MSLLLFSMAWSPETKEMALGGNVSPQLALDQLQQIVLRVELEKLKGKKNESQDVPDLQSPP